LTRRQTPVLKTSRGTRRFVLRKNAYRESRDGLTVYELTDDDDQVEEVELLEEDIRSGGRWFRETVPERWTEDDPRKSWIHAMCRRSLQDYGEQFVLYKGKWHKVVEVMERDEK
jgi:hypothetical protein